MLDFNITKVHGDNNSRNMMKNQHSFQNRGYRTFYIEDISMNIVCRSFTHCNKRKQWLRNCMPKWQDDFSKFLLICSTCHSFNFLFHLPWTWRFMTKSASASRNAEDAYHTGAPGQCSQILVESELLLINFYFSACSFWFFNVSMLCGSVFHVWS